MKGVERSILKTEDSKQRGKRRKEIGIGGEKSILKKDSKQQEKRRKTNQRKTTRGNGKTLTAEDKRKQNST